MVSLHKYYLSTILELECSTHLELVINYVKTHTIKRFTYYAIHWKCNCKPSIGVLKCLWVCTYRYHCLYTSKFSILDY
jgi:hypothetical protein